MTSIPIAEETEYSFEDKLIERAKEQDCIIVYAAEDELQLDIDSPELYNAFTERYNEMQDRISYFNSPIKLEITRDELSKGGNGRHVTIKVVGIKLRLLEKIALQFALHSDPKREFLNTVRVLTGSINAICFFEKE